MKYTKIPDEFKKEYEEKFKKKSLSLDEIEKDIVIWSYSMLGIKLRPYQAWCIHNIINSKRKRIALCWARQLGKSIALGVFAFWATFYNRYPATVENITTCYIMSRDDETAKELLEKIRGIIKMGDRNLEKKKKVRKYFTSKYGKPDNQHQITWSHNSSFIKSVPPTDTVVGKSASIFIVDEAAKLKVISPYTDKRLYYEVVEPTTSETGGFLILSSTPNGATGLFYDLFDPEDGFQDHDFERIWFPYTINDTPEYIDFVEDKRKKMERTGELKLWQQEYKAMFTITQDSFFEISDIEKGIDEDLAPIYEYKKGKCVMAIDYGMNPSRTVITIKTEIDGKFTTINQIRFEADFDENYLMDETCENSVPNLCKRYNIWKIVVDDCPQGNTTNNWMDKKGYPVELFNFRTDQTKGDRNRGFYKYRTALRAGKIKYPNIKELIEEMKIIEETKLAINVSIKAPRGSLCDCVDSEMMATMPFLDENEFSSFTTGEDKEAEQKEAQNAYIDKEWEDFQSSKDNSWIIKEIKRIGGNQHG